MKNANIFVDVDLTLVDEFGRMLEGASDALRLMKERGCHLYLWSSNGGEYARSVATRLGLEGLFEGFSAKPDIVIDDMPQTAMPAFVYDVRREESWTHLAKEILRRHVD